jgi:hypothetical protein
VGDKRFPACDRLHFHRGLFHTASAAEIMGTIPKRVYVNLMSFYAGILVLAVAADDSPTRPSSAQHFLLVSFRVAFGSTSISTFNDVEFPFGNHLLIRKISQSNALANPVDYSTGSPSICGCRN